MHLSLTSPAAKWRCLFAVLAFALSASILSAAERPQALPTLTSIRQIRALSLEQAQRGYPVRVRGVVTFYHVVPPGAKPTRNLDLDSNMFIQDGTGGNWVGPATGQPALKVGDFIELEGTTEWTDFSPDIVRPHWHVLGTAPMPRPLKAEFGRLASSSADAIWVESEGIVRSAEPTRNDLRLEIDMDGGRVVGFIPDSPMPVPAQLIDAKVRVRGVAGAIFSNKNQVLGVSIFIPSLDDVQLLEPGIVNPFAIPVQPVSSILRFRAAGTAGHRLRIRGIVSLQRLGQYAYVKGPDESARVESTQSISLKAGDLVDAVGFPLIGEYAPILQQGVFRVIGHSAPPVPSVVKIEQLVDGKRDGDLIQIDGELLDRVLTPSEQILIVKSGGAIVQAQLEDPKAVDSLRLIERGSRLRLEGICTTVADHKGGTGAIRLLLRTPADIRVLSRPSWLTFQHALWIVASLSIVILAILSWLAILRHKVREQTQVIRRRLESEAALEHRYRHLFERNLAGVYRMKLDGRLVDCNDACARMLGCSGRDELLECESPDAIRLSPAIAALVRGNNKSASSELCLRRKDGCEIWVLVNASLLEGEQDGTIEGTIIEITELKRTVRMLEERTTQLSALLENNPLAIAVMDSERRVVMCNPAFERLFAFDAAEVIGQSIDKCILPPELAGESQELLQILDQGQIVFRKTRRMRKDSTLVNVEAYGVPLIIEGQKSGCFAMYLDIDDRVAAEAELRRMKEAAEAANRAKSAFLANISHEIRTPLSGVLMAANLAVAENTSPDQKEYLDTIIACGKSLQLLLNDVLDLSKIEAGKMELQISDFSIRECLADCIRLWGNNARQKGLALTLAVDDDIPDLFSGDALRLRQIVLNLVGNAIKFTEHGSVAVSARSNGWSHGQLSLVFSVRDTGIGIPPEKHSLVFREFEQAEDTTSRIFGGTGLGLAISSKLARLMGGEMWLESDVGRGSIFHFTANFRPAKGIEKSDGIIQPGRSDDRLNILIAEDNSINRRLATRQLEKYGHVVTAVDNGKKAIEISMAHRFDVILMDVHMPEVDGIEATRRIRQQEISTGMHVPIIALTAGAMKQDRDACLEAGMDAYLSKPINPDELLSTVATVLRSFRTHSVVCNT